MGGSKMCRTRWKTLRLTSHRCGLRFADWMLQDAAEMYCRQSKSAGKCPLVPPHATTKASTNQTQTYGRLWEPGRRTWNSQTMSEIHSHSLPSRECQSQTTSHNTQTIPYPDEFVAVRSDATLCIALCKPRRPSVQLLQRESIRARWLEMARVSSAACGFIVLHYHIDLSLSPSLSLQGSCGLKEMKSKYSLNMFESSWKVVQHRVWSGLVRAWLQRPCPYTIAKSVCEIGMWIDQQIKKAVREIVHDTTAFLDSTTQ